MIKLNPIQKKYLLILLLIAAVYFAAFWFPNAVASEDVEMVTIFEPDEGAPLPFLLDMLQPADGSAPTLRNFLSYGYYFYGFPYFALSALTLIPQTLAGNLGDIAQVMVTLRQFVNLLPILGAMLVLVYLQTKFKTYKSIVVFIFLLAIPAVVQNNLWWHPDGLAILFAFLALFFLDRDNLRFGANFYLAAALIGLAAQTKGIGFYFFLAVFVYLLLGWRQARFSLGKLALAAGGFLLVMGVVYFASNPILLYGPARARFFGIMSEQSDLLSEGYGVIYGKGLAASATIVRQYYGGYLLPLVMLAVTVWGALRGPNKLLHALILAWFVPITVFIFFLSHFKYQYWLPVILPIYSSLALLLPDSRQQLADWWRQSPQRLPGGLAAAALLIALLQFGFSLPTDVALYQERLHRADADPSLAFYPLAAEALAPLPQGSYFVYHDVQVYFPQSERWHTNTSFKLLTYDYILANDFQILLLMEQRIRDYLNSGVEGIDPDEFARAQVFYRDADSEALRGYQLIFRNEFGLVFVSQSLYERYFTNGN